MYFSLFFVTLHAMKRLRTYFILTIIAFVIASCTDGEQMRQRLADVQACNQADTVFSSRWLPTVDSLVDYFDSHGTPNERLMAHYLQGRVYHDMGEAPQAIDCYQQAVEQVDTAAEDCDFRTLMSVYGQMSHLFHAQFLPDDEISAIKSVAEIAHKRNDAFMEAIAVGRLSGPYFLKNDTDSVLIVENQARELFLQQGHKENAALAISASIHIALNRHCIPKAEELLAIYRNESGLFDNNGESVMGGVYYVEKGIYMNLVEELDSAQHYFHKAINYGQYEGGYKGLLSVYEKLKIPDSIAKYARLFANANDSSFLHVNQESVHRISSLYNFTRQQRIAEAKSLEASRNRQYLAISLFLGVFISILACFYIFWQRHRKKTEMRHIELEFQHQINMLEQAKYDLEKLKQKEYDALLTQKQEEINEWQQEVEKMRQQTNPQCILDSKIVETDIYQRLQFVVAHPAEKMKKTDWTRLNEMINELLPHFVHRINALYHVSEEDYRICMLIRLNFSLSEICILTGLTPKLLYKRRKFMSKKFFSSDEKPELFDKRIKNIS